MSSDRIVITGVAINTPIGDTLDLVAIIYYLENQPSATGATLTPVTFIQKLEVRFLNMTLKASYTHLATVFPI